MVTTISKNEQDIIKGWISKKRYTYLISYPHLIEALKTTSLRALLPKDLSEESYNVIYRYPQSWLIPICLDLTCRYGVSGAVLGSLIEADMQLVKTMHTYIELFRKKQLGGQFLAQMANMLGDETQNIWCQVVLPRHYNKKVHPKRMLAFLTRCRNQWRRQEAQRMSLTTYIIKMANKEMPL